MFQPLPELTIRVQDGWFVVVAPTGHGQVEREHAARVEPGRYILQASETPNEKSCADQQDDRERQFRNHEQPSNIVAAAPDRARSGRTTARIFQSGVDIQP